MPKRRLRLIPVPETVETEEVRCRTCGARFLIERGRLFVMCAACGAIMARERAGETAA